MRSGGVAAFFSGPSEREQLLNVIHNKGELDNRLGDKQLSKISRHIVRWEAKAYALGLTEVEIEDIKEDYKHNDMRTVAMLRKWAKKFGDEATLRTLIEVSFEYNWTSFIRSVSLSLGYKYKHTGYSYLGKCLLSVFGVVCLIAGLIIFGPDIHPKASQSLPNTKDDFYGRDKDLNILLDIVDFSNGSVRFINIVGPPGFGKSALAINLGHKMLAKRTEVHYIDLIDFPDKNFKYELAQRILMDDNYIKKDVTFDNLLRWGRKRWWNNRLIILDNCDENIKSQKEDFYGSVSKLLMHSDRNLKIITTSREVLFHSDNHFPYKVKPIDTESAGQILEFRNPSLLSEDEKHTIAQLTGEVPLALKIVGALLSNRMNSATEIVENLRKHPIDTLSPQELQSSLRLNASISLSYNYLDQNVQKVGQYLSLFPGSFDRYMALNVLYPLTKLNLFSKVDLSFKKLVQLSLLEYDEKLKRYYYHKLIKDYFSTNNPILENEFFMFGMRKFYSVELCKMAEEFKRSPKAALHKLDLDRHHIHLLMSHTALLMSVEDQHFDRNLSSCFLEAVTTKYLNIRFTRQEIISVLHSLTNSFEETVIRNISVTTKYLNIRFTRQEIISVLLSLTNSFEETVVRNTSNKDRIELVVIILKMFPDFNVYANLAIKLSELMQGNEQNEIVDLLSLAVVDLFCTVCDTDTCDDHYACRKFYSHILLYEDRFDAKTAMLYHIRFLERNEESQIQCKSTDTSECKYGLIGNSYLNLKNYTKAKFFFEKAIYDEGFEYCMNDRLFMLLWLRNNFNESIDLERIANDLEQVYDYILNLTSAELYGIPCNLVQGYQSYLYDIGEYDKAYSIQEYWVQSMNEIGVETTQQQINFSGAAVLKLNRKGHYNRSLTMVNNALSVIKAETNRTDYIYFQQLKGSIMYWMNNLTESDKAYRIAIEQLILNNRTSNEIIFEQLCRDLLYYLHDVDYIWICYSNKLKTQAYFISETVLYVLLKAPFEHVSNKSPKRSRKVDLPLEYFPSLSQQSHRTDLMSNETGEVYIFKPDFSAFITPLIGKVLGIVKEFCTNLIELNSLRFCCNVVSIFVRLVIIWLLFQTLCYITTRFFRIFHHALYFITLLLCVKTKWL